jgi:hypothetical protein
MNTFSLHDQGAAFLSAGLIAKSDKIQSTRFALSLWAEMRQKLSIKSRLDYLVAILTYGQVMDRRLERGDYFQLISDSITNIRRELVSAITYPILGEKGGTQELADSYIVRLNDAASAILAAAYTSVSTKVESTKELVEIWVKLREMSMVNDNNEYLTALLACSRLNDLKQMIDRGGGLGLILDNFKTLLQSVEPGLSVTKRDLAAAHLTIAFVSQSSEIETSGRVLGTWEELKKELSLEDDDLTITSAILSSGLILNKTMKLSISDIKNIYSTIKENLLETAKSGSELDS